MTERESAHPGNHNIPVELLAEISINGHDSEKDSGTVTNANTSVESSPSQEKPTSVSESFSSPQITRKTVPTSSISSPVVHKSASVVSTIIHVF